MSGWFSVKKTELTVVTQSCFTDQA